jgi:D-alanyl-lipoteichoic acid acyltransferase DltB (MBOAT superfamily)
MAVGLAALLGYRFPHNFNQPYRAASLQDFWRRWHISLSSWLRDYLYIALGGSRTGLARLCLALMTTMLLGGLWHGASWNFVIWGALHGGVLAIERLWREFKPAGAPSLPPILGILITFHIVTLGWIFFRSTSFADASPSSAAWARAAGRPCSRPCSSPDRARHGAALPAAPRDPGRRRPRPRDAGDAGRRRHRRSDPADRRDAPRGRRPFIYYQF